MGALSSRNVVRFAHLAGAGILGTYVYSPWAGVDWFRFLVQAVVFPTLAASGVWLWKGHAVRRWWASVAKRSLPRQTRP